MWVFCARVLLTYRISSFRFCALVSFLCVRVVYVLHVSLPVTWIACSCFQLEVSQHGCQGMTIRTARLPGAGNLLGRAGKNLSGLPDRASRYQFCFISFFICFYWQYHISIQALDFESRLQFLFCGSTIATSVSFYIIKPSNFSVVACDWLASVVKPIWS